MRKAEIIALLLVVVSFVIGIYVCPMLPDQVASHWDANSVVNGYMPKLVGVFLLPVILLILALLFFAIPRIDPLKKNIQSFRGYFDGFIILIFIVLILVYLQTLVWNFGILISFNLTFPIMFGLLFFYIGIMLKHSKRNWFIGIRTPWTLSSDEVWDKTHQRGGLLFQIAGIISIIGILFNGYAIYFVLVSVIAAAIYSFVYSYFVYKKKA